MELPSFFTKNLTSLISVTTRSFTVGYEYNYTYFNMSIKHYIYDDFNTADLSPCDIIIIIYSL